MQIKLNNNTISLSDAPKNNVPGALLLLDKKFKSTFIDVLKEKQEYKLPKGVNQKDVVSIYLRIY